MKRMIRASNNRSSNRQIVRDVCDQLGQNYPTFVTKGKTGFACKWGGLTAVEREVEKLSQKEKANLHDIVDQLTEEYGRNDSVYQDPRYVEAYESYKNKRRQSYGQAKANVASRLEEASKQVGRKLELSPSGKIVILYDEV